MAIGQKMVFDDPDNVCFGCSPHNERGLQLGFTHVGPGRVEGEYLAPAHILGEILDPGGEVLTSATARWRRLD